MVGRCWFGKMKNSDVSTSDKKYLIGKKKIKQKKKTPFYLMHSRNKGLCSLDLL